jgi:hypothetical protein
MDTLNQWLLISFSSHSPVASGTARADQLQLLTYFLLVESRISAFHLKCEIGPLILQVCKEEAQ